MSIIVQIQNKEEEEVKEEIVTQAIMMQYFESDSRLKLMITLRRLGTKTKNR